jgi:exonuclease 3'-5' domain-containing protein 1
MAVGSKTRKSSAPGWSSEINALRWAIYDQADSPSGVTSKKTSRNRKLEEGDITSLVDSLKKTNLDGDLPSILVDSPDGVTDLVDSLFNLPTSPPSLYLDIEGINLSRYGTVSILQIFVSTKQLTYLIDIHTLGHKAFSTSGARGITLQDILQSDSIPKVFFDVRNDSDALYSHYGIALGGIRDLQLMELAVRSSSKKFVHGLAKCIDRDGGLTMRERRACMEIKDRGRALFAPELGGSYEVFNARPLAEEIRAYCVQDVQFLPFLWWKYNRLMNTLWKEKVDKETKNRVSDSQGDNYQPNGKHKVLGPW